MSYGRTSRNLNLELSVDEINACLTDHANQNLTKAQKELLRLNYRFGHIGMQRIQSAIRNGQLATMQEQKVMHIAASKCDVPKCVACEFAKAKKQRSKRCRDSTPRLSTMQLRAAPSMIKSFQATKSLWITLFAAQKVGCSDRLERPSTRQCIQVRQSSWT
jgi:hypothetical protein